MGKLFDELKSEREEKGTFYRLRKAMSDEDFADFIKAMKDPTISGGAISRALQKRDIKVVASTINLLRKNLNENI